MAKFKLNIKILSCGFPPVIGKYIIDNFELKSETLDEKLIISRMKENGIIKSVIEK